MTQVTAEMQEIIDRFGWAEGWPTVAKAAMDLCKHLDARLIALEAAKPQAQPGWFDVAKQYAAEVDDLRNVNAGLRKENARLTAERDAAKREVAELLQSNANLSDKLYG